MHEGSRCAATTGFLILHLSAHPGEEEEEEEGLQHPQRADTNVSPLRDESSWVRTTKVGRDHCDHSARPSRDPPVPSREQSRTKPSTITAPAHEGRLCTIPAAAPSAAQPRGYLHSRRSSACPRGSALPPAQVHGSKRRIRTAERGSRRDLEGKVGRAQPHRSESGALHRGGSHPRGTAEPHSPEQRSQRPHSAAGNAAAPGGRPREGGGIKGVGSRAAVHPELGGEGGGGGERREPRGRRANLMQIMEINK